MNHEELKALLDAANGAEIAGNYDETERLARNVIQSTDPATRVNIHYHIRALLQLGSIELRRGNYPKALERFTIALDQSERFDDKEGMAKVLGSIGRVYGRLSDYTKALEYYQKALRLVETLGDVAGVATWLGNIGTVYVELSDYPKALESHGRALRIDEERFNKAGVAKSLGNIGNVYRNLSDYPKALEYFNKALSIAEELGNKSGMALWLGGLGQVHSNLSDYPKALEYCVMALRINEELGDKVGVANTQSIIGGVHLKLSDNPKALEYFVKALSISEELGNTSGVALHLGNIGIVHVNLSDYPKALEYFGKALSMDEELGIKAGVARHLGNIGVVYEKLQDFERALEYYNRGMHLLEDLGAKSESSYFKGRIGGLYASAAWSGHDYAKAEEYLLESIAESQQLGTKKYDAHKTLAELFEMQRRWYEAYYHQGKYFRLKEEVQSEEAQKKAQLMEQQKKIAEREKEIAIAKAAADAQMSATTTLLYKVLPQTIATRLIKGEKVADYFRDVSVLFADIVGFTPIASRMPARAVLAFLNYVFGEFDRIMERNGCEKIKTMGDGYLAVAGAPLECSDHAERVTRAALEMMGDIILPDEIRKTIPKGAEFSIRIGIHMGPCFAGIVGENRFVYDIYSDAVNIAARMESHGEAGKIHISDEFCFHLQNRMDATGEDFGGIRFDEREEMEIKGKGMMRTYFLERV